MAVQIPSDFTPARRPMLVGSFPHTRHETAVELVLTHTPDYPVWPQLPVFKQEGMMQQYLVGLPGLTLAGGKVRVDEEMPGYAEDLLAFFEALLTKDPHAFAMGPDTARGIFALEEGIASAARAPLGIKGQVVGPFTQATGATDTEGRALYFDHHQREAVTGLLAARAAWQVRYYKEALGLPVIIFIDEPGLAGFGSSAFLGVSRDEVVESLAQVVGAIHAQGGIAGIHVCGNTDWGLVMETGADIINFDAAGYFDRVLLYAEDLKRFVGEGGCLAWGMVPTEPSEAIAAARVEEMEAAFHGHVDALCDLGMDRDRILDQSIITPACGMGSRTPEEAQRVLDMLTELSDRLRK